ncbi:MAG: LysE family transporter, partial [Neisseriaceae bacterium]|nr:LysE family transporter [Neisseriaceae bacterium]
MSLEFLLITFLITASPGTGVVYTVAMGLSRGCQASMVAALGCTLGIVPHLIAALLGLSELLHASSLAFNLLKYAG